MKLTGFSYVAILSLAMSVSIVSCSKDDDVNEPDRTEQGGGGSSSNPIVGKTIRYTENWSDSSRRVKVNDSYTFNADNTYVMSLNELVEDWDIFAKDWVTAGYVKKTEEGEYIYTDSKITLKPYNGGKYYLTKVSGGWSAGGDQIFK